jgi:hypothetical protein
VFSVDIDSTLGFSHIVDVGSVTDRLEVHLQLECQSG